MTKIRVFSMVILFSSLTLTSYSIFGADKDEAKIKQIVQGVLKEKDHKIEQLEQRIQQLEQESQNKVVLEKKSEFDKELANKAPSKDDKSDIATDTSEASKPVEKSAEKSENVIVSAIEEVKKEAEEKGLEISGFFDVNAKTGNSTDQPFNVGSIELDLDYAINDKIGMSAALAFCGNSPNTDTTAPPAIYCGNGGPGGLSGANMAGFSVALIDYHVFGGKEPPRGRILSDYEMHIQAGRFDVPFGSDYQYFANTDRVTITMPLTTSRMQLGGYSGDGIRSFGAWRMLNYILYATDALYANDGYVFGGRLGIDLDESHYNLHGTGVDGFEMGLSHLSEFNGADQIRNSVYGADISASYGIFRWLNEFMYIQSHQNQVLDTSSNLVYTSSVNASDDTFLTFLPFGKTHQLGYHSTLIANLENYVKQPVLAFARFSRWEPSKKLGLDYDGATVNWGDISMLSVGLNYKLGEHLTFKVEYDDSLGTSIKERYFDEKMGIGQVIMSF